MWKLALNADTIFGLRLLYKIKGPPLPQDKVRDGVVLGKEVCEELAGVQPPVEGQRQIAGFDSLEIAGNLYKVAGFAG